MTTNERRKEGVLANKPTIQSLKVSVTTLTFLEGPAEVTFKAGLAGVLFGILFGAANAYLGLRAGLTISTSIPISVMTFRVLQALRINNTILESNMSQTIGSASSSLAGGIIFTLPTLFLWEMDPMFVVAQLIFNDNNGTGFYILAFLLSSKNLLFAKPPGISAGMLGSKRQQLKLPSSNFQRKGHSPAEHGQLRPTRKFFK